MAVKPPKKPAYSHDPDAILDYPFDWAPNVDKDGKTVESWLVFGDAIATATVVASTIDDDPSPLTVGVVSITDGAGLSTRTNGQTRENSAVVAWISGGTLGNTYNCVCHITTTDGREEDQTITLVVQQH